MSRQPLKLQNCEIASSTVSQFSDACFPRECVLGDHHSLVKARWTLNALGRWSESNWECISDKSSWGGTPYMLWSVWMNRVVKRSGILVTFQGFRGSCKSWTMHFMETFYVLVLLYVTMCHVHLYMNVCIYIHICLYIYTHILYRCCKANGVAFISACPWFKA